VAEPTYPMQTKPPVSMGSYTGITSRYPEARPLIKDQLNRLQEQKALKRRQLQEMSRNQYA
jgi:hypothetical protein